MQNKNALDCEWPDTNSKDFQTMYSQWKDVLDKYQSYELALSKNSNSNKANSYLHTLIRILLNYPTYFDMPLPTPTNYRNQFFLENLDNFTSFPGYKKFNNLKGRFPNAAIRGFLSFADLSDEEQNKIINMNNAAIYPKAEYKISQNNLDNKNTTPVSTPVTTSKPIPAAQISQKRNVFVKEHTRDRNIKKYCVKAAHYKCEYDAKHTTFPIIGPNDKIIQYTEGHHLIPVSKQEQFKDKNGVPIPLDTVENMVSLCPTCHRAVHYAATDTREKILTKLYKLKIDGLKKANLNLTLSELLSIYGISK